MKYHLQYTDEKSSKFWKIKQEEKTQTISYGKIGANGKTTTKAFPTIEAAKKSTEKLVNSKVKKGYVIISEKDSSGKSWFNNLTSKLFDAYKNAILKYKIKEYKYIQLHCTGQGFALGLGLNATDEHHEYIETSNLDYDEEISLEHFYREIENIPLEEYDSDDDCEYEVEFKRNEWPKDSTDCFELECFLINVILGLTFIKLEKDSQVKSYLSAIEVVKLVTSGKDLKPFNYHQPDIKIKTSVIYTLIKNDAERELVLSLWDDNTKDSGLAFLNHLQKRKIAKIKALPKLSLSKAYKKAYDLNLRFKFKEAVDVLQPVLENALNNAKADSELIEKCCDVLGEASGNAKTKYVESVYWFKKGLEFMPNGQCALSLMSLYYLDLREPKPLIEFCEEHLKNINQDDDVTYTVECYRYLAKGYLEILDKESALAVYRKLLDFVTRMNQKSCIEDVVEDLEDYSDWQDEYKIANEILTWLNASAAQ